MNNINNTNNNIEHILGSESLRESLSPTQKEFHHFLNSIELPKREERHISPYNKLFMSMALACSVFVFISIYSYNSPMVLLEIGAYDRAIHIEADNAHTQIMELSSNDEIFENDPIVTDEELAMI